MSEHDPMARAKRTYHSKLRQRQAEETRRRMLAAARALFVARGYAGTTIEAIADAAGVSPKTVVAAFGSKRTMLAELVDPAAPGSQFEAALTELRAEADPTRRVALVARLTRSVYETSAVDLELLRGANTIGPELSQVAAGVEERRWRQQEHLVTFLRDHGALRAELVDAQATDQVWALTSFDLYRLLVVQRGWSPARYEAWLTALLSSVLLAQP